MSTAKKSGGLKGLSINRLAQVVSIVTGERVKKYKDKTSAIKAIGRVSKQNLVLAILKTGGASVDELVAIFSVKRAYARDIISKLVIRGEKVVQNDDKVFSA